MSRYIITGGQPLRGEVSIRGAKNASFKQIIASMLSSGTTRLSNIPQISDVKITESIAKKIGATTNWLSDHCLEITTPKITSSIVPQGTGQKSRTSFIFSAPLLLRTGKATIPTPGGDRLGARPLNRLFDCLSTMNIKINVNDKKIEFSTDKITNTDYTFEKPSHTATEVVVMIACLTPGQTIFRNSALEPEIDDLITMLNSMGAEVKRDNQTPSTIIINGVSKLSGTNHQVIPDRNEAITFASAALATKGSINILNVSTSIIQTFINTIKIMGAEVKSGPEETKISWVKPLKAIKIDTSPEPGFMTDWQAVFTVVLTQAIGSSTLIERVWPYRFHHIPMLQKMGAKFKLFNPKIKQPDSYYFFNPDSDSPDYFHAVKIYGPVHLTGTKLKVNDLRAGACITLAALTASGQTIIDNVELIQRGYENLADRLRSLGANIKFVKTSN